MEYSKDNYKINHSFYCEKNTNFPIVIASPQLGADYSHQLYGINKYYFQNLKYQSSVRSLQDANDGESGYDINNDKGFVFLVSSFDCNAVKLVQGKPAGADLAKIIGDYVLGLITSDIPYWDVMDFILTAADVGIWAGENCKNYELLHQESYNKYEVNVKEQAKTKFIRDCKVEFKSKTGENLILRPRNLPDELNSGLDFWTVTIYLDHQVTDRLYRSVYRSDYIFSLATADGSEHYDIKCPYTTVIGDQFKQINEDQVTMDYITDDYSSYFMFTAQNSGEYEIFTKGNYRTWLKLYSDKNLNNLLSSGQTQDDLNHIIRLDLTKGTTYYLQADTYGDEGRRIFPVVINYIPDKISLNKTINAEINNSPVKFSYLAEETKNFELTATSKEPYRIVVRVQMLDEENSKQNIILGERGDNLQFLAKAGVRYFFEIDRSELEPSGDSIPVSLELHEGKSMQFGETIQLIKGQNCVKFNAPIEGRYLFEYVQSDIRNLGFYSKDGSEISHDSQTNSVLLSKGINFIGIQTFNGNNKFTMSLYTGEQGTFSIGSKNEENFTYTLLNGCKYLKLKASEGMYKISSTVGTVINIYCIDFEIPISREGDIFYLKEDTYYVKIEGATSGILKVIKTSLDSEYSIGIQNSDETLQIDRVLKGNPYDIVVLDKQGKIIELENVTYTLRYNDKTESIDGNRFTVPGDAEAGTTIEIIGNYQGSELLQTCEVVNPFDLMTEEIVSVKDGKMVVNYSVKAEEAGMLNDAYKLNLTYTFFHDNEIISTATLQDVSYEQPIVKDFTEARRYINLDLVLRLECIVGEECFYYDTTKNLDQPPQSMPLKSKTLSNELVFLTHSDVTGAITYEVDPKVKLLLIEGEKGYEYNIQLDIKERSEPILLYLTNFKSRVSSGNVINTNGTLCLWCYGTSELIAGNGTAKKFTPEDGQTLLDFENKNTNESTIDGGHAIRAMNVYINGESLKLHGGNGANGIGFGTQDFYSTVLYTYISGENGGDGGNGILAYGIVNINLKSFEAHGGNGGNGCDGASEYVKTDSTYFYKGYEGVCGGHGGNGGIAIECKQFIANELSSDSSINLYSGNGGNGGNGGYGKDGLSGDDRSSVAPNGENGYDGGSGGNGGANGYAIKIDTAESNRFSAITLHGGTAGNGGRGGNGGNGGDGKSTSTWGSTGGKGGDGGYAGAGGDAKSVATVNTGSYGWKIYKSQKGEGGKGGAGGIGGTGGNGGLFGSKGDDGETMPQGANGKVIEV